MTSVMVMKTLKRLSRLYPQELTEHFIYLPAVSLEMLGDHAAMQDLARQVRNPPAHRRKIRPGLQGQPARRP
jgi:hypothetical protein